MNTPLNALNSLLVALVYVIVASAFADTIKQSDLTAALDVTTSKSITILGSCPNAVLKKTFANDNIGYVEYGSGDKETWKKVAVSPTRGATFLEMGDGKAAYVTTENRSSRMVSYFSFEVAGARTITFDYRAALYGGNDDELIFYEKDPNDTLNSSDLCGDYWQKKYTPESGGVDGGLDYEDFWQEGEIELEPTSYFHTVNVAVLKPYAASKEEYDDPSTMTKDKDGYEILQKVWLDNLFAEQSEYTVCDFSWSSGTSFGANGLNVQIDSDYVDSGRNLVLTYYYTLDGSNPANSTTRRLYNDAAGIDVKETCVLKVAAYEGERLISNEFNASYTRRDVPRSPTCTATAQTPFDDAPIEITFSAKGEVAERYLEYFYTTDGTEPTMESSTGKTITIGNPCTLKVVSCDDGSLSSVSTFHIARCATPSFACVCDGYDSDRCFFCENVSVTLKKHSGLSVFYRVNGGEPAEYTTSLQFTKDATVEAMCCVTANEGELASGDNILLNSTVVSLNVRKAGTCGVDWLEEQLTGKPGWKILGISIDIPPKHCAELAKWLRPYGFNPKTKSFEVPEVLECGNAYWVYMTEAGLPAKNRPKTFYGMEREEDPERLSGWQFLDYGASLFYDGIKYINVSPVEELPGWSKITQ